MTTDRERLQTAQWVLERNLAWIAAAEVKVGVIVAIDTAMLGGLGAALSATDAATRTHWAWFFLIASVACLCCGLFCAAMSVLPRITGPAKSLLFFGRINAFNEADYMASFKAATDTDLLEDWLAPKQAKTLSDRELQRLLDFVATTKSPKRNRAILMLTHLAGMRIGECAALRICDVLASDGTVRSQFTLSAEQTKGSSSRTVLLNQRIQAELAVYLQSLRVRDTKLPLFASQRSAGFTANSLTQVVNGIYKKAGFDQCSSHSGRRSFATRASSKGISMRVLQKLLGHKNIQTTSIYIYASDDMLRNAVELV